MQKYLSLFGRYYRAGLTTWEAAHLVYDHLGLDEYFFWALYLGVNPCKIVPRKGEKWEACFRRNVRAVEAQAKRDKILNTLCAGVTLEHEEMYPTMGDPYMPWYMRQVLSHIHDEEIEKQRKPLGKSGYMSTRELHVQAAMLKQ